MVFQNTVVSDSSETLCNTYDHEMMRFYCERPVTTILCIKSKSTTTPTATTTTRTTSTTHDTTEEDEVEEGVSIALATVLLIVYTIVNIVLCLRYSCRLLRRQHYAAESTLTHKFTIDGGDNDGTDDYRTLLNDVDELMSDHAAIEETKFR